MNITNSFVKKTQTFNKKQISIKPNTSKKKHEKFPNHHLVDRLAAGGLRLQMRQGCGSCDTASQWAIGDAERYTWRWKHVQVRSNEASSDPMDPITLSDDDWGV